MHLKIALLAIVGLQLASGQPIQLSPVLQFKQSQGHVIAPRQPSITTKTAQQAAALRSQAPVVSAVITKHTQEVVDVPVDDAVSLPQIVIVEPHMQPVTIEFRSKSSPVKINTVHVPGEKGKVESTRHEEEPDRIIHEVVKPVIQEIREIIQPFRKITQQILPVQEEVHSIVTKGERRSEVEQVTDDAALAGGLNEQQQPQQQQLLVVQPAPQQTLIATPVVQQQPANTVVQAGLVGGTRILPASEQIYEQQREIVSAIAAPGGLKKKRSANIFRFDLP